MESERNYIYSLVFEDFLGLSLEDFQFEYENKKIKISRDSKEFVLSDCFFSMPPNRYLSIESLPSQPLSKLDLSTGSLFQDLLENELPIIYGASKTIIEVDHIELGLDIFGSSFFMLTRYEEVIKTDRDHHNRFPAWASLAYQEGFLERPIVDEYVEVLWCCMSYLWPNLDRKAHHHKINVSCDVDWPFTPAFSSFAGMVKRLGKNIFFNQNSIIADIRNFNQHRLGSYTNDPFYTFDFLLDEYEKNSLTGTFYFIAGHSAGKMDGVYSVFDKNIHRLIEKIYSRGHEIGLHPSYNSYNNLRVLSTELENLSQAVKTVDSSINIKKSRQHFLRQDINETFFLLSEIGIKQDSSLGYADHIGFRSGTSKKYSLFDINKRKELNLIESPLHVMEVTMLDKQYMNMNYETALAKAKSVKEYCEKYNGTFSFLWHNNNFYNEDDFKLFSQILEA
ncbi:polysaccharide deacetylase family protein [Reichenbachiella sp. MSK19-1]|uniref:polysaccharide deacetylase family protein n=1 Tax=Reichenbachiella sp. MSK19-1 TaxID=1897631 RepID=UPI000E6B8489|nr:polysaccharide deacetylase family protein [Reichenbachiella sp. MSK19-1]RJE71715.1 hypothetical protein BGP76_06405 [Reichenbachiella sp. MSK19-1]